jgi:hypothetical protein
MTVNGIGAVVGAAGRQGGAAARAPLGAGLTLRALVRDPAKPAARALAAAGVQLVITNFEDDGGQRISVFGADRAEICGAFKPLDRPYWLMYVTKTLAEAVDRSQPTVIPHRIPLPAQQDASMAPTHRRPVPEGGEPVRRAEQCVGPRVTQPGDPATGKRVHRCREASSSSGYW